MKTLPSAQGSTSLHGTYRSIITLQNTTLSPSLQSPFNMQFTAAVLAVFATMAAAQDTSLIPACARPCFEDSLGLSGCAGETDFTCLCAYVRPTRSADAVLIERPALVS